MDRRLELQTNALQSYQQNIQPGRIAGLLLYFNGKNATSETNDLSVLGNVVIKRGGTTIVNRKVEVFDGINDIRSGKNLFSSTVSAAFAATVFVPFYELSLEQALNITDPSELNFTYEAGSGATWDNLTLSVYSVQSFKPELYQYYILGDDQTEAGAVASRPYQLNRANITSLYLRDNPGSSPILTSVGLRQNGKQKFSEQPKDVLIAGTLLDNMLEVSTTDMIELQTFTLGEPLSTANANSVIEITTSGAGTVEITICAIEWHAQAV